MNQSLTNVREAAVRVLSRKELPFAEVLTGAFIVSMLWVLHAGGAFRLSDRNPLAANERRMTLLMMAAEAHRWANSAYPADPGELTCKGREARTCIPLADPALLRDIWGTPYMYRNNGQSFTIVSLGADGKDGGEGLDADVILEGR